MEFYFQVSGVGIVYFIRYVLFLFKLNILCIVPTNHFYPTIENLGDFFCDTKTN